MKEKNQGAPINQDEIYHYLKDIRKIKVMTPDREKQLALKMKSDEISDRERKKIEEELLEGNLRFVITVAKQYQNQGLDLPDLIAEGNLGFGKTLNSSYFITISTGIGAAFIANHQLKHSSEEAGHMLVPFAGGFEELEKVASGQGIVNLAKHHGVEVTDAKTFFLRLGQQDSKIKLIFQEWLDYLIQFLKWVDRYYSPQAFILTGGVLKSKAFFWDALQASVPHIPLALASFGQDAGLMGAANLAFSLI
jgi:hypothetical protein